MIAATPDGLLQEACTLKSWGFPAFPLARKKPRCRWKHYQHRRPSDCELGRLFRLSGVDGVAVVPGPLSGGFAVRDYDRPRAYYRWAESHPDLAHTLPTARTKRGFHVWSRSTVPVYRAMDDGEFIGDGRHYCVVPPSRHPQGSEYQWMNGWPLGPSAFPLLDPFEAGFLSVPSPGRRGRGVAIRHSSSSGVFSASASTVPLPTRIRECILKTQPTGPGQRNRLLHQLARSLRDHLPTNALPTLLHDTVLAWWQMALPVIDTKDFDTTLNDFRRAWSAVLVPMSMSRPLAALRRGCAESGATDSRGRLLAACRELARENDGDFYLSRRVAGEAIGVSGTRAGVLLERLVASRELVIVRRGRPSPRKRQGATVFRLATAHERRHR